MRTIVALVALASLAFAGGAAAHVNKGHKPQAASVTASVAVNETDLHYGDRVTFTVVSDPTPEVPSIALKCYQDGVWVYQLMEPYDYSFPLAGEGVSSGWSGGAANCTADLFYFTYTGQDESGTVDLATTSFDVGA